jgi:hypothetical protein
MVSVQLPVPVQAPDQPAKKAPEAGMAVSLTLVPELNDPVQVDGQLMPAGVLVTVPRAVPASCTLSWYAVVRARLRLATGLTLSHWSKKEQPLM